MSIWIKDKNNNQCLAPHSYEKTLLGLGRLVCWIEGTNTKISERIGKRGFGIAGSPIWTNYGILFTKSDLEELVSKMKDGAELRIAYPDQYISTNNSRYKEEITIEESFTKDNDMIQTGPNRFSPSKTVLKWLQSRSEEIHPDYLEYCKEKLHFND